MQFDPHPGANEASEETLPQALPRKRNIQHRIRYRYATVTLATFLAAISQSLFCGLVAAFVQQTRFFRFDVAQLILVVPDHALLWRSICVVSCVSSVLMVLVFASWSNIVGRRFRPLPLFALLLMAMSAYATIDSFLTLMTQFSDLSREAGHSYNPNQLGTMAMISVTITHVLGHLLLMSCTLEGAATLILSLCSFLCRGFPHSVAWLSLLLSLAIVNISVLAFAGNLDAALLLYLLTRVAIVVWTSTFGSVYTFRTVRTEAATVVAGLQSGN